MAGKIPQAESYQKEPPGFNLDGYRPVPIVQQLRAVILQRVRQGQEVLPGIDGRQETKADVARAILSGAHPYLVSEEGTGKTRLARSLTYLLPEIPVVRGCSYNDDPKWPRESLCPRCAKSKNPAREFGITLVPGWRRFSRIQGNEYTNEAKVLGLKDIQAIAQGRSPADPEVFTGTGVFKANRGILFVDELPAIRTKVQVLFHPILEERKAILEEYNWEHPLDLIVIATGNPKGFAHVNEVPRPLLDRLELIYMDLPEEKVEGEIMLKERFRLRKPGDGPEGETALPTADLDVDRTVIAPWWILDLVNKAVRYSRICPSVEKKPSIRATYRSIDHTYASAELENRKVVSLRHAFLGLRLALRGRVGLRAEYVDFDNPRKTFQIGDQLSEDFLWNALEDMGKEVSVLDGGTDGRAVAEIESLFSLGVLASGSVPDEALANSAELKTAIERCRKMWGDRVNAALIPEREKLIYNKPERFTDVERAEFNYSCLEFLTNLAVHKGILAEAKVRGFYSPKKFAGAG
ncbi:MAG: 5 protein [Dehalococcoidia bacterium]|nr:5 protein [Dehalococcoidia bacterium]